MEKEKQKIINAMLWLVILLGLLPALFITAANIFPKNMSDSYENLSTALFHASAPVVYIILFCLGVILIYHSGKLIKAILLLPLLFLALFPIFSTPPQSTLDHIRTDIADFKSKFPKLQSDISKASPFVTDHVLSDVKVNSVSIDMEKLERYCADTSGCLITLTLRNFTAETLRQGEIWSSGPVSFHYNAETKRWRTNGGIVGTVGAGRPIDVANLYACYFTEKNQKGVDDEEQFYLLITNRYKGQKVICSIIIRD